MADPTFTVTDGIYLSGPSGYLGYFGGDSDYQVITQNKRFTVTISDLDPSLIINIDGTVLMKSLTVEDKFSVSNQFGTFTTEILKQNSGGITGPKAGDTTLSYSGTLRLGPLDQGNFDTVINGNLVFKNDTNNGSLEVGTARLNEAFFGSVVAADSYLYSLKSIHIGTESQIDHAIINHGRVKYKTSSNNEELEVAIARTTGAYFTGTAVGDTCIRSTKNLHLGSSSTSNAVTVQNELNVNGDLNLNGELYLQGNILKYSQGTWTPEFKYLDSSGVSEPGGTITYDYQYGYYSRVGSRISCFFDLQFTFAPTSSGLKFVAIGNAPIKIGVYSQSADFISSAALTASEFPNGLGAGLIPFIGGPVYSSGFKVSAFEEGYNYPLFTNVLAEFPAGSWISDGFHFPISADGQNYVPAVTIPPWSLVNETHQPLSNLYCSTPLATFTGCRFAGTIDYWTDD